MTFDASTVMTLIGLGLTAGVLGGLLGIGGGVVGVPGMVLLLGLGAPVTRSASLLMSALVGLSGAWRHRREGCLLPRAVVFMLVGAVLGGGVGALVGGYLDRWRWIFPAVFAGFLLFVLLQNARRLLRGVEGEPAQFGADNPYEVDSKRAMGLMVVGLPTGFLGGLLGIGGGAVAVPLQQVVLRMPLRNAIACSSAAVVGTAATAATAAIALATNQAVEGFPWLPVKVAGVLVPGAVIGAQLGAKLTHLLPLRVVRTVFLGLMLVVCFKMGQRSVHLYRAASAPSVALAEDRP